ncbi:helix-turn-helix domain-containing protein [Nonomuraea lactucae]|uniref:helix-turn-helix domain-containing protein n=1 Tax=Nonomuraea lactucae TaxID=2249762 RepID=UPI000DE20939|nr:helix-turn-helix transcriptional regulator [Nonomuraea lactucae]
MVGEDNFPLLTRLDLDPPSFGELLRTLRIRRGLTLRELSQETGISRSKLSRLERGTARPTPADVRALASTHGIPVKHLMSRVTNGDSSVPPLLEMSVAM